MIELRTLTGLVEKAALKFLGQSEGACRNETQKDDGSIVTSTDAGIQSFIESGLAKLTPDIPFLGEEMAHFSQVSVVNGASSRFWVLDPLDGTTNFVAGFPFYGISLALIESGHPVLAVIHDPIRRETFSAIKGDGAFLNGIQIRSQSVQTLRQCIANIDYKRLTRSVADRLVRSPPYRSQRNLGSCVLEWCWLATGRFQLYLHGGQKLWDYAAGSLILEEAGGKSRSFEGRPLDCRTLGKRSVIAAVSPELQAKWSDWVFREGGLEGVHSMMGKVSIP